MTAKTTAQRPSSLVRIRDTWAALQFDNAVTLVGITLENAANELHEVGMGKHKKMAPKYTLAQLLEPDFRLPAPKSKAQTSIDDLAGIRGINIVRKK